MFICRSDTGAATTVTNHVRVLDSGVLEFWLLVSFDIVEAFKPGPEDSMHTTV